MSFHNTDQYLLHTTRPGKYILSVVAALLLALAISPGKAHAQIIGEIEVNVPFPFHAGNAKLPAGKYVIHMLDDSDLTIMEISTLDGSTSALFEVQPTQASSAPAKSELIFKKYGNRYFLAKVFDGGSSDGSRLIVSRYEKSVSQAMAATEEHVPAGHRKQQGN